MTASTNIALPAEFPRRRGLEATLAILVVTVVTLIATEPNVIVFAVCIPLVFLAAFSFDWFVYSLIFLLPWYPIHNIFLPARYAFFVAVCILRCREGASLKSLLWQGWLRKGALAFAAISAVSLLVSDFRTFGSAYGSLGRQISYVAMFLGIAGWAYTRERMLRIIRVILVSTLGVCLFGFYQAFDGSFTAFYFHLYPGLEEIYESLGGWTGRITSFLGHYNSLAGYLNAVAPLALGVAVIARDRSLRVLGFVCLAATGAAVYLTGSRGGLAGYGAICFVGICYLSPRRKTIAVLLMASILAAAAGLTLAYLGDLEGARRKVDDFTLESRVAMWGAATIIFLQHPVLGGGVGTFRYRFHPYVPGIQEDLDAHNLYLHTLAEIGIVGFLIFFATMWRFFRQGVELSRRNDELAMIIGVGTVGALAALTVHGLVDYIFLVSPQFGTMFWMLMGLGTAATEVTL